MAVLNFDVVIAGGSFGGCAAALAAAADKKVKVALLEAGEWVGGQATSQGLTRWDETAAELTESTGSARSYRELRDLIREHYAGVRSELGQQQKFFNPGFAGVGPPFTTTNNPLHFSDADGRGHSFAAEPKVVLEVLEKLLHDAGVTVVSGATVTAVDAHGGAVHGFTVRTASGSDTYVGKVYLDATDLGDVLPLCGVKWVIGAEAKSDTEEDEAEGAAHPEWIQPFTVPIAVQWVDADPNNRIAKPVNYDDIRTRQGFDRIKVANVKGDVGDGDIKKVFNPKMEGDTLINYRQFIDPRNFKDGRSWRTTLNVGGNDYLTRAIPTHPHSAEEDARIIEEGRAVSIAYVYYIQNDVPRDDLHGTGYLNVKIDEETFDRADGTAPAPYIRESRRLANPRFRVVRKHIDAEAHGGQWGHHGSLNVGQLGLGSKSQRATNFRDSCGIGQYGIDVHPGFYSRTGGVNDAAKPNIGTPWHGFGTVPFQIPLGALLPKELSNFVAACKNIGATHLTSGAYRVHPIEWAIGEAAGVLAAYCTATGVSPADVWSDDSRLTEYQLRLLARGTPIFWWDDVVFEHNVRAFAAIQLLGARGTFQGDGETRNFDPNGELPDDVRSALQKEFDVTLPAGVKRGEAAVLICEKLRLPLP